MPGLGVAITLHYILTARLSARCLKDAGRARCWAHQISCDANLGSRIFFFKFVFIY